MNHSIDTNRALATELIATVWNGGDTDALSALLTPDYVDHAYVPQNAVGHAHMARTLRAAFGDARHTILQITAQQDMVVLRIRITGHHTGTFRDVAASGHAIDVIQYRTLRIVDGRIAEHWSLFDTATLMRQIDAASHPHACAPK